MTRHRIQKILSTRAKEASVLSILSYKHDSMSAVDDPRKPLGRTWSAVDDPRKPLGHSKPWTSVCQSEMHGVAAIPDTGAKGYAVSGAAV